ncbi:methyltransferase domain-containing protein [Actinomadura soli]|uniref:Protein-L-isoaspartate O-methyltransferase n=1 Tax=Actinomadura soli TaxID=2508997 RepID=A0A5C4J2M3_9ACTN|nr:methyltransferase domain-containing protein [Actinomadura soli]TMQ90995.1 methyltransferase domain-containing protein [Actinomadura soli]
MSTDDSTAADERNRAMIEELRAAGLFEAGVADAMLTTPRHWLAPDAGWLIPDRGAGPGRAVNRQADPAAWWRAVYSDGSIITQREDGAVAADSAHGSPTSSLSAPGVVAEFLELLTVRPRDRVLEIGTGTGWTAALLTRMGADVTTVEIDPGVAEQAAANLKATSSPPHLITGDGAAGWAEGAPYDRVHSTCAVARVPYAWVEQTRPGGVTVAPWQPAAGGGWKLRLTVAGSRAVGRVHGPAGYVMLRAQRSNGQWNPHHAAEATTTRTRLDPRAITQSGGMALAVDPVRRAEVVGRGRGRVRLVGGQRRTWRGPLQSHHRRAGRTTVVPALTDSSVGRPPRHVREAPSYRLVTLRNQRATRGWTDTAPRTLID